MSEPVEPVADPAQPTSSAPEDPGARELAAAVEPPSQPASDDVASVAVTHPGIEREGAALVPSAARGPSDNTLRLTFTFLSAIAAATVLTWGTLMGPCNAHPPQSQKFKQASFEKLVARPQDAAIEFHHSLFIQDYERARKLASGTAVEIVDAAERDCDVVCKQQKLDRVDRAVTRSILHRMKAGSAWVTVETFFDDRMVAESYEVKRIEQKWLVARVTPPPPPDPPAPKPTAVPSASAAASASVAASASAASSAPAASSAAATNSVPVATSSALPVTSAPAASSASHPIEPQK